jgi:coenzyme F420-0:L-glutamate ligase/coenzyme F420-1:gamma-L-glutamate ligase
MIAIHPLAAIGEVLPGADLATLLGEALAAAGLLPFAPGDVLVVTQKIVSKAEDRFVDLATVTPGPEAETLAATTRKDPRLVELILRESTEVVRAVPNVLITRHRHGHVMANSGIDRSNLGPEGGARALLLPIDADASAAALATALGCAIVISDSFGRPWRYGVVGVAIGAAGLPALVDRRGELDRDGRRLEVTQVALADMLATAAALATGEGAESVPAALIRGLHLPEGDAPAAALVRPLAEDLFR